MLTLKYLHAYKQKNHTERDQNMSQLCTHHCPISFFIKNAEAFHKILVRPLFTRRTIFTIKCTI